jgi:hypothetical protein
LVHGFSDAGELLTNGHDESAEWKQGTTSLRLETRKRTIRIRRTSSVFLLEDSEERIQWFFLNLKGVAAVQWKSNVEDALPLLSLLEPDAIVFLDHDLCVSDAAYPDIRPGSGQRAAKFLSINRFPGEVYIHSVNERGATAMKTHLPKAILAPFGTFAIEIV